MGCTETENGRKTDRKFKINWPVYDLAMKNEDGWFIDNAMKLVEDMPPPWEINRRGRPCHPPKPLVVVILLKIKHKKTYRELESHLKANDLYKKLGFKTPPSKSTIHKAMGKLPQEYIDDLDLKLEEMLKRGRSSSQGN
jgi:hypothetical protein